MAKFTIPIMYEFDSGDTILGTGTLARFGGRHFVITASHLFDKDEFRKNFGEEFDPEKLACPNRRTTMPEKPTTFGDFQLVRSKQTWFDFDVAFLELKSKEKIEALSSGWTFIGPELVGERKKAPEEIFLLAGYPGKLVRPVSRSAYSGPLLLIQTEPLAQPPSEARRPVHARFDLFFKYAKQGVLDSGAIADTPELHGTSGGPVAQVILADDQLWLPSKAIKIVGVQSSGSDDRMWFRAKSWLGVIELLRREVPDVAREVEAALQSGGQS